MGLNFTIEGEEGKVNLRVSVFPWDLCFLPHSPPAFTPPRSILGEDSFTACQSRETKASCGWQSLLSPKDFMQTISFSIISTLDIPFFPSTYLSREEGKSGGFSEEEEGAISGA